MAGFTIIKKIGSGQVFTTLQGWEDGAPVNYTTAEQSAAGSFAVAAFTQGETLSFVGSGAAGKFLGTDSTGVGNGTYVQYGITSGNPASGDVVTGATSGATCTLSSSTPQFTGVVWEGQINAASDVFSGSTTLLNISGGTVSSSAFARLTTASGAAFRDVSGIATRALKFDSTSGCAITSSVAFGNVVTVNQDFTELSKLQIEASADNGSGIGHTSGTTQTYDGLIVEATHGQVVSVSGASVSLRNCLFVNRGTVGAFASVAIMNSGVVARCCTFVTPSDKLKPTNVIAQSYGTPANSNCAFFFGTGLKGGSATPTYTTCATDVGSPPSGVTQMTYNTSLFNNITDATRDFRTPTGSGLRAAGTTDAIVATDIYGTSRTGVAYDIGCWQFVAGFKSAFTVNSNVTIQSGARAG